MIVEIGHFALVLAFALSLVLSVAPLVGARMGDARLMGLAEPAALSILALVASFEPDAPPVPTPVEVTAPTHGEVSLQLDPPRPPCIGEVSRWAPVRPWNWNLLSQEPSRCASRPMAMSPSKKHSQFNPEPEPYSPSTWRRCPKKPR